MTPDEIRITTARHVAHVCRERGNQIHPWDLCVTAFATGIEPQDVTKEILRALVPLSGYAASYARSEEARTMNYFWRNIVQTAERMLGVRDSITLEKEEP